MHVIRISPVHRDYLATSSDIYKVESNSSLKLLGIGTNEGYQIFKPDGLKAQKTGFSKMELTLIFQKWMEVLASIEVQLIQYYEDLKVLQLELF